MKKNLLLFSCLSFLTCFQLYSQINYQWGFTMGGNLTDSPYDMDTDKDGDIYIAGYISEPFDFDPNENIVFPMNLNSSCMYFAKYSNTGEFKFVKSLGNGITSGSINSINVDSEKNIYISGYSYGRIDFDPGPDSLILESNEWTVGFFAKYDSVGNIIFANPITTFSSGVLSTVDKNNNLIIYGTFVDSVDFDFGPDSYYLDGGDWGSINYLAKYDSMGDLLYAVKFDTIPTILGIPNMLITDAQGDDGNVIFTGFFAGVVDFDPGNDVYLLDSGEKESFFIANFNPFGELMFAKGLIGNEGTYCINSYIDIDKFNNIYLAGNFNGTIDVDPGQGVNEMISNNVENTFFSKFNDSGELIFAKQIINSGGNNGIYGLIVGESENIYLDGVFSGNVDLDPGVGEATYNVLNASDIFISKYDNTGNYLSSIVVGGYDFEIPFGMAIDEQGDLYLAGEFFENINLDPYGEDIYTSNGYQDIFVAKYGQNLTPTSNLVPDKNIITVTPNPGTGVFWISLPSSEGINSISIVDLNGNEVYAKQQFSDTILVDLEQLPPGVYLGIVRNTSGVQTVKLVKI